MKLVIGNKNYSSWSLRAWLMLAANNITFEEIRIPLSRPSTAAEIEKYNKAGMVPVLLDNDIVIWDSLSICEYISEQYLNGNGWPEHIKARAEARSCSAEMHSGFFSIRNNLPMNCRANNRKISVTPEIQEEIARVDELWSESRTKYSDSGPWLFGRFSIADCMFAPMVFRFRTYNIALSSVSKEYVKSLLAHEKVQQWLDGARKEVESIEEDEAGL